MKKLITLLSISSLLLIGCGAEEESEATNETIEPDTTEEVVEEEESTDEPSQEELNEELKEEATEIDFVTANSEEYTEEDRLYAEGEVSMLEQDVMDTFILTTEEEEGYGMFAVEAFNTEDVEYSDGDMIRIYGTYKGKDDNGTPLLGATIIEPI